MRRTPDLRLGAGLTALVLGISSLGLGLAGTTSAGAVETPVVTEPAQPSDDPSPEPLPTDAPSPSPSPSLSPTASPVPTEDPAPEEADTELVVDDAQFNWALSQQTNAMSHNVGAPNFLGAGVANPGRGGVELTESRWSAKAGNVTVQKQDASGAWRTATWKGIRTDAHDAPIGLYGPFSGHRVNFVSGQGTVNPAADDASIRWKGTFTVVYYGGNTVFTLTDPEMRVTNGKGTVTATAGGWIADRNNPKQWDPAVPKRVTVADLSDVDVTEDGVVVTPDYAGVKIKGSEPQRRTGEGWGSFPQSLITYLVPLNTDQFWYSTGLQSDWTKLPAPIQAGWNGRLPDVPGETVPPKSKPSAKPSNAVVLPPAPSDVDTPGRTTPAPTGNVVPSPGPAVPDPLPSAQTAGQPTTVPSASGPVPSAAEPSYQAFGPHTTVTSDVGALHATLTSATTDAEAGWWVGGGLLLAAAAVLLAPTPRRRPS
ncbi:hypothetical protein [Nocardioides yefusunii]|uniref:Htaa domain-containing protein n=1 Tax=Nocardioides yefusunii TaxID=2500546 RepID=A0ABW1R1D7_9ACTN|nr:hypothetical protein [Nocardioides yefusunii]